MTDRRIRPDHEKGEFEPIRFPLGPLYTDQVTEKVIQTIVDDEAYARFVIDPHRYLAAEGICRNNVSEMEIIELIQQLRYRASAPDNPQSLGATDQKKEKEKGTQWNFDNSKKYIAKVEGAYYAERGRSTEKETQELMQKDEGFKKNGSGDDAVARLLFSDDPDFSPAQPLVSPALLAKIRASQNTR
jgi:hypothetical protein